MRTLIPLVVSFMCISATVQAVDTISPIGDPIRQELPRLYRSYPAARRLITLEIPTGAKVDDVLIGLRREGDPVIINTIGDFAVLKSPLRVRDMEMPLVIAWIAYVADGSVAVDGEARMVISKHEK